MNLRVLSAATLNQLDTDHRQFFRRTTSNQLWSLVVKMLCFEVALLPHCASLSEFTDSTMNFASYQRGLFESWSWTRQGPFNGIIIQITSGNPPKECPKKKTLQITVERPKQNQDRRSRQTREDLKWANKQTPAIPCFFSRRISHAAAAFLVFGFRYTTFNWRPCLKEDQIFSYPNMPKKKKKKSQYFP